MTFRKGQEVVCVVQVPDVRDVDLWPELPKLGQHYTVRSARGCGCGCEMLVICVEEILGGIHPISGDECGFASSIFRPVVKTNISIFTEILERESIPSTEKEKV